MSGAAASRCAPHAARNAACARLARVASRVRSATLPGPPTGEVSALAASAPETAPETAPLPLTCARAKHCAACSSSRSASRRHSRNGAPSAIHVASGLLSANACPSASCAAPNRRHALSAL